MKPSLLHPLRLAIPVFCGAAFLAGPAPLAAQETQPASRMISLEGDSITEQTPYYTAFGEVVTVGDFFEQMRDLPADLRPQNLELEIEAFRAMDPEQRRLLASDLVIYQQATQDAKAEGFTPDAESMEQLLARQNQAIAKVWLDENVNSKVEEPSDEEIAAYYEDKKESRFTQREQLQFRHIFFSTYKDYVVEAGDTLESIAEKMTGDASRASDILDSRSKEARSADVEDREGNMVPAQALVEGEVLLVPMSEAETQAILEKARSAYQRVTEGGEPFEDVASELSEADRPGRLLVINPGDGKQILGPIRETFDTLKDGEISEPVKTRHGYQIINRVRHRPDGPQPLDEVRDVISSTLDRERRTAIIDESFDRLWDEYRAADPKPETSPGKSIDIDEEVLAAAFTTAEPEDVIVATDAGSYTVQAFRLDFGRDFNEETPLEELLAAMDRVGLVRRELLFWDTNRKKLTETQEFADLNKALEDRFYAARYLENKMQSAIEEPSEEELRTFYEENMDRYSRDASLLLRQITKRPPIPADATEAERERILEEERAKLAKELEGVDTIDGFTAKVKELSEDDFVKADGSVGRVGLEWRDGLGQGIYDANPKSRIFGPIVWGDEVLAHYIVRRDEPRTAEFEDAKADINQQIMNKRNAAAREKIVSEMNEKAGYEYHLGS
ncbi:MAG: peptidyl-prolyl cis-trans isomerase [Sumerlaeia bacterium]